MAKIKNESNAEDDAKLIQEHKRTRTQQDGPGGFSVTGRTGAQRDGHPDGWQTGGRGDNNR